MGADMDMRRAISALLDAGKTPTAIVRDLSCARSTVYKVKNLKKAGQGLDYAFTPQKKSVLTPRVRAGVKRRIKAAPTKSLRRVADEAGLNREAVQCGGLSRILAGKVLERSKSPLFQQKDDKKGI